MWIYEWVIHTCPHICSGAYTNVCVTVYLYVGVLPIPCAHMRICVWYVCLSVLQPLSSFQISTPSANLRMSCSHLLPKHVFWGNTCGQDRCSCISGLVGKPPTLFCAELSWGKWKCNRRRGSTMVKEDWGGEMVRLQCRIYMSTLRWTLEVNC